MTAFEIRKWLFVAGLAVSRLQCPAAAAPVTQDVELRYVSPGLAAWWLDPAHNAEPALSVPLAQLQDGAGASWNPWAPDGRYVLPLGDPGSFAEDIYTRSNARRFGKDARPAAKSVFKLPRGVESVVPAEGRGALRVRGTAEGLAQLRPLVRFLDRPMRVVELEARFVLLTRPAIDALDLDRDQAGSDGPFRLNTTGRAPVHVDEEQKPPKTGVPILKTVPVLGKLFSEDARAERLRRERGPYTHSGWLLLTEAPRDTLDDLEKRRLVKIVGSSVSRVLNNSTTSASFQLSPAAGGAARAGAGPVAAVRQGFYLTPTINNDETVTFAFAQFRGKADANGGEPPFPGYGQPFSIANFRDGETLVCKRLSHPEVSTPPLYRFWPELEAPHQKSGSGPEYVDLVLFLTGRIVRRAF